MGPLSEVESSCKLADVEETRPGCVDSKIVPPITCQLQPEEWQAGPIILLFAFVAKDSFGRDSYCKGLNNVTRSHPSLVLLGGKKY